jgi:hypothetical protein
MRLMQRLGNSRRVRARAQKRLFADWQRGIESFIYPEVAMIVDLVSGWSENLGDGSPIWDIADAIADLSGRATAPRVRRHTCGKALKPFLGGGSALPVTRRLWIVYSYGCARLWRDLAGLKDGGEVAAMIDHLVIIAGVPRLWDGQFEISDARGIWHIDPQIIKAATCFSPRGVCIPESQPIKNPSPVFQNVLVADVDHSSIVSAVRADVLKIAEDLWDADSADSVNSLAARSPEATTLREGPIDPLSGVQCG